MNKKETIEALERIIDIVTSRGVEINDSDISFTNKTIDRVHPEKPWLEKKFYTGERSMQINIYYTDGNIIRKEQEKQKKWIEES